MTPKRWHQRIAAMIIIASCLYSPLGWCPPPPGPLLPHLQTYDFGKVPQGESATVTISYSLDPNYTFVPGPWVVSDSPYRFVITQGGAFSVDASQTSCVPGIAITSTTGCVVTVAFSPTAVGPASVLFFELAVCQGISSSCSSPLIGSSVTLIGAGVASPGAVPLIYGGWLFMLIALFVVALPLAWSLRKRAP
jgi:hypothetical protein